MTAPGGFTAGDVLSAADMNALPGGSKGLAQVTSDLGSVTDTFADVSGLSITFSGVAGRRYLVTLYANPSHNGALADLNVVEFRLTNAAASVVFSSATVVAHGGDVNNTVFLSYITTATGSSTVKAQVKREGANTVTLRASAALPMQLSVIDIGLDV
jgi:hypothetical protein